DADEVGAVVAHLVVVDGGPPQPRLLHHVLGVGGGAEHLVGDGEQKPAVPRERVIAHAEAAYPRDACANGTAHESEKPCDSMPSAVFERVVMLANPTSAVSSTIAAAPSWSSRRAESSSVTRGGVSLIASAYS